MLTVVLRSRATFLRFFSIEGSSPATLFERRGKPVFLVCLSRCRKDADGRRRHHLDEQASPARLEPDDIALYRMRRHIARQTIDFAIEEIGEQPPEHLPGRTPVAAKFLRQKLPAEVIEAGDAARGIQHQHIFRVDFRQSMVRREL